MFHNLVEKPVLCMSFEEESPRLLSIWGEDFEFYSQNAALMLNPS